LNSAVSLPPALALRDIRKSFGGVLALDGARLVVERGTVHGLVGQNGAGKSTLIKVLAGIHAPDSGQIVIDGVEYAHLNPRRIEQLGIHMIHQDRLLPPTLTVAEAIFIGREPRWRGLPFIDRARMNREARKALTRAFDIDLPPTALIWELSSAEQQLVQITRALLNKPKLLVFDEPTTALVQREADLLFSTIERLRTEGLTILYISHYLNEISRLCDKVTVLRNGVDVATIDGKTGSAGIVALMIDREVDDLFPTRSRRLGAPMLTTQNLTRRGAYSDVSLMVQRGEILGVTGLVGSGAKALVEGLFGLATPTSGQIVLDAKRVTLGSPKSAVANRIGLVPEDRRAHGVCLDLTVRENASLANLKAFSLSGFLNRAKERSAVRDFIDRLGIRTPSTETPVRALSGGNQQKVALCKWLIRGSDLVILDEPTVGVDVGAKVDIYREIGALADAGAAIVVVSSDLLELIGLTDRILVFYRGKIVADVQSAETGQDRLLSLLTTGRNAEGSRDAAA
jgi:ribose transport system ATP-binding protein